MYAPDSGATMSPTLPHVRWRKALLQRSRTLGFHARKCSSSGALYALQPTCMPGASPHAECAHAACAGGGDHCGLPNAGVRYLAMRVVDVGLSSRVRVRGPGSIMACHVHVRRGVARLAARCLSTLRGRACVGAWVDEWKLLLVWQYVARHGGRWSSKTPNSTMFEETRI